MATANIKKEIHVYADWQGLAVPNKIGTLIVTPSRGKETFSFEYTAGWLKSGFSQMLDPDLQLYSGVYYPRDEKVNFGIFLDSCPDRWGRVLMQRREAIIAKNEERKAKTLLESDYLLGVFDAHRMGALRFKLPEDGPYLNDNKVMASTPFSSLRELEQASLKFEEDNIDEPEYLKWINMLIAPGSSLGGARPKASVVDPQNNLWIAKFPSKNDEKNVAAWEMVTKDGVLVGKDLEELWRRIVFGICVKNTDDHLRNHGFLLSEVGWALSPAYDINPNEYGNGLSLNISENDNSLHTELALEVAGYFRLDNKKSNKIVSHIKSTVCFWREIAENTRFQKLSRIECRLHFHLKSK